MKTVIKHTALAAAVAAGFIVTQIGHAESARGDAVTERRAVGAFSAIDLSGPYKVVVRAQGKPSLELSGERKQLDDIETVVRGDTLVVRPVARNGFHFSLGKRRDSVTVYITASMLKSLKTNGNGDVELEQIGGDQFSLTSEGPGDLRASGAVRELAVKSSGSGDVDVHRVKAANVTVAMTGPGDVHLAGVGNELTAMVSGAGDLEAQDLRVARVVAQMSGPGNVKLTGVGRELRAEVSGAGDLEACGLSVERSSTVQRGPGNACVSGNLKKFEAEVHGSGELWASGLQTQFAQIRITGPGNVSLAGATADLNAELSGSGDLEAGGLKVRKATVKSRGPGAVTLATVTDTLDAELRGAGDLKATMAGKRLLLKMSGPGDAHIDGSVAQVNVQLNGAGSFEGRRLLAGQADIAVQGPGTAAINLQQKADRRGARSERSDILVVDRSGRRQLVE